MRSFMSFTHARPSESSNRQTPYHRLISLSVTSVLVAGWVTGGVLMGPVKNAAAKAGQADKNSVENQKLWDELDEIDWMRDLAPLKLAPEQIDKMIPLLDKANTVFEQNVNELSTNTIGQIAADIHMEHKDALGGTPIPKEFDTKVEEKLKNYYERRDAVATQNRAHMCDAFEKILTPDQEKIAIKLSKAYFVKMGKTPGPKDTDDTFYALYVNNVFVTKYPRIVPLLKQIKEIGK